MTPIAADIRHQLVTLARRPRSRITAFRQELPTDWRPGTVNNPENDLGFSDAGAWELIASKLEKGMTSTSCHSISPTEQRA